MNALCGLSTSRRVYWIFLNNECFAISFRSESLTKAFLSYRHPFSRCLLRHSNRINNQICLVMRTFKQFKMIPCTKLVAIICTHERCRTWMDCQRILPLGSGIDSPYVYFTNVPKLLKHTPLFAVLSAQLRYHEYCLCDKNKSRSIFRFTNALYKSW